MTDSTPSSRRALQIWEILENVLYQLFTEPVIFDTVLWDFKGDKKVESKIPNFHQIQLVCQSWKKVIDQSPRLQAALFLRPSPGYASSILECQPNPYIWNNLITTWDGTYNLKSGAFGRTFLHQLSREILAARPDHLVPLRKTPKNTFSHANASWRGMEITNPPLKNLHINMQDSRFHPFYIEGEGGITFQDVIDAIVSECLTIESLTDLSDFMYQLRRTDSPDLLHSLSGQTILYLRLWTE